MIGNVAGHNAVSDSNVIHNELDHAHKKPRLHAFSPVLVESHHHQQQQHSIPAAVPLDSLPVLKNVEDNHDRVAGDRPTSAQSMKLSISAPSSSPVSAVPSRNIHRIEPNHKVISTGAEAATVQEIQQHSQLEDHEQHELMRQWMDCDYEEEELDDHTEESPNEALNGDNELITSISSHNKLVLVPSHQNK
jgi:hypothetical protein